MKQQHRARRLALQCTCCLDVQGDRSVEMIERFCKDSRETPETVDLAREMVSAVRQHRVAIDEILSRHARHWSLDRLALVDRNILRLCTAELLAGATPHKVVIAEALRLAQEFSTLESPRFVNGVLDAVARDLTAWRDTRAQ